MKHESLTVLGELFVRFSNSLNGRYFVNSTLTQVLDRLEFPGCPLQFFTFVKFLFDPPFT